MSSMGRAAVNASAGTLGRAAAVLMDSVFAVGGPAVFSVSCHAVSFLGRAAASTMSTRVPQLAWAARP